MCWSKLRVKSGGVGSGSGSSRGRVSVVLGVDSMSSWVGSGRGLGRVGDESGSCWGRLRVKSARVESGSGWSRGWVGVLLGSILVKSGGVGSGSGSGRGRVGIVLGVQAFPNRSADWDRTEKVSTCEVFSGRNPHLLLQATTREFPNVRISSNAHPQNQPRLSKAITLAYFQLVTMGLLTKNLSCFGSKKHV